MIPKQQAFVAPPEAFGGGDFKSEKEFQSMVVSWMRLPMALMVVFIHFYGDTMLNSEPVAGSEVFDSLRILMCHVISRAAVPCFFVISGYYFFSHPQPFTFNAYKEKLRKRMNTLLIPYLLWNTLCLGQVLLMKVGGVLVKGNPWSGIIDYIEEKGWIDIFWSCNEWPFMLSWLGNPLNSTGPLLVPMWFVRDLMVVIVLAPLIYKALHIMNGRWFLALMFFCGMSCIWPSIPGLSINAIFYFSIGAMLALKGLYITECFRRWRKPVYAAIMVLTPVMVYYDGHYTTVGNYIYPLYVFVLMVGYFNISQLFVRKGWLIGLSKFGSAGFFVFAFHVFILGYIGAAVSKILGTWVADCGLWPIACIAYIAVPVLTTVLCCAIYFVLCQYAPRLLGVLTGDR